MAHPAEDLLDELKEMPRRVERSQTFMEIAGYPHYENVCSNFLAFFFDPEEMHGLGSLFIDALSEAAGIDGEEVGFGGNVYVEREVATGVGNRIDLLIASDFHAVLIENKILAGANNPFEDYANHLESEDFDGLTKHKVLLTLKPTSEGREWGFVNLTYPNFIDRVRSMIGHHVSYADTRYLTIALDFLNTLENLREGSRMNHEFIELLNERGDEVESLFSDVLNFKNELRKKVRELGSLVDVAAHPNIHQFFWREGTSLYDDLGHNIRVSEDLLVAIDTLIDSRGWETHIWPREGSPSDLREVLRGSEISVEGDSHLFRNQSRFVYSQRFDYDEDLNVIATVVRELVEKIAAHSG